MQKTIDKYVTNALTALEEMKTFNQEQVDAITEAMAQAGMQNHMKLAKMAIEETKKGIYEDKMTKNMFATEYILNSIKDIQTVGVIDDNDMEGYEIVAEPIGVIAGVTPVTNPTSTTMFKSIISMKTRNPIIFAFHPFAQKCSLEAARILKEAAIAQGAPKDCIQWIESPSIEATNCLMAHPNISLILATGGSGMVKAAYSMGKPALGVGPGNVPCYIEKTANIKRATTDLIMSKTFDNGMICASEQAVIVDQEIQKAFEDFAKENDCVFLSANDVKKLEKTVIDQDKQAMSPKIVGQSAYDIAKMAGIEVPKSTKILIAPQKDVGPDYPLSREKLSPVLAYYVAKTVQEGIEYSEKMVMFGGLGHSAVIHSQDQNVIDEFSAKVKVGRLIINSPSTFGAIGDIYNTNVPSLTLGCGSFGGNSTLSNVSVEQLINKKRVAKRRVNMQWFKIPPKIYFEKGSVQYLQDMPEISRAFIVTDPMMVKLGYVKKVLYYLRNRKQYVNSEIFDGVEPDPSIDTIVNGVKMMKNFKPDVIIAIGGGSVIDAAKGMWVFYENPETNFEAMKLKFMDIRKRIYQFPKLGRTSRMVAIPTTSGTGSEVTSFSVITDKKEGVKYPFADYELTPDVAIIDPQFVMTVPKSITADTGMDVLTHAIEAYVSVFASDYTDGLALKAIQLVFDYLPRAYHNPGDELAREKMHNASCIAGMAFTNAFLGVNHSLAHKLGGEFHVPHGRANAVLLPHVIEYNRNKPSKFVPFPKYETFIAHEKYGEIAKSIGAKPDATTLIEKINGLMDEIEMPKRIRDLGIDKKTYFDKIEELADRAYEDQCTTANPRSPLISELIEIYKKAF